MEKMNYYDEPPTRLEKYMAYGFAALMLCIFLGFGGCLIYAGWC